MDETAARIHGWPVLFQYIYLKHNIMEENEVRAYMKKQDLLKGIPDPDVKEFNEKINRVLDEAKAKEKKVIENMFSTVTAQYADKERQSLRLEAAKLAIQAGYTQYESIEDCADRIYNWITKPE